MPAGLWADMFVDYQDGRTILHAMPLMLAVLAILAIAYRYYSAFLAAKVAALDDAQVTPAHRFYDGQNYHPTSKWVLFGHHFAAISGAGPLIGPVLAIQYGYMPGLVWLVVGVCLAGAVQDMLVLAASVRRDGKSLAEIARTELGPWARMVVSAAILFIVIIALAGLGFVVVKALGGEEVKLPNGMRIVVMANERLQLDRASADTAVAKFPPGCHIQYTANTPESVRPEPFTVRLPGAGSLTIDGSGLMTNISPGGDGIVGGDKEFAVTLKEGGTQIIPGSSWGTFTIACTIPIAMLVGLWMFKIRPGKVWGASFFGALAVIAATVGGNFIRGTALEPYFSLSREGTIWALCLYGFFASVLPVWLLLCPRDYLSSYLKIGTVALLIVGVLAANPRLEAPMYNEVFAQNGPTFKGGVFPFVFICIMCGAISGFHSLVSSGTTPKMVEKESHIRTIGYGAMLMEGLVGVVALIAAASLDPKLYYDINVPLDQADKWQKDLDKMYKELGNADVVHLNLAQVEEGVGGESLRGRTGGAVTLAVGMSQILTTPLHRLGLPFEQLMKYWYHFAIMFEALFILTTIDAGTRIARFLLQEALGKLHPKFEQTDWWPGAILATALVTAGWGILIHTGSISTIWPMFGIANQLLAVIALCLVTTLLVQSGRGRYAWVTVLPMLFVISTTMTAGVQLIIYQFPVLPNKVQGMLNTICALFVMACVAALLLIAAARWLAVALRVNRT